MSTSNQRKAKRRKADPLDFAAIQEGAAIDRKFQIGVVHTPRLKLTYHMDGYTYHTGAKHRQGGGLRHEHTDGIRPVAKPMRRMNGKQRNMRSEQVHKRVENPQLYKTLDTKRIVHKMEYKAGIVRANNQL